MFQCQKHPVLVLNPFLFSVLLIYVFIGGLSANFSYFLIVYSKWSWLPETEYDPPGNSNLSFHVGTVNLNFSFLYELFLFFHV